MTRYLIATLTICTGLTSCQMSPCELEPSFCYTAPHNYIDQLSSPFPKLTVVEKTHDWGRELFLGRAFARQMDFYRAITCFKSALFLIPKNCEARRLEIEYDIFLSYYLAGKYQDAIDTFETGRLVHAPDDFPAMHDLLIALYDAYMQTDQCDHAIRVLSLITAKDEDTAQNLTIGTNIMDGDISSIIQASQGSAIQDEIDTFVCDYGVAMKSVSKARALNAVLPGAGYYYVGQKRAAVTSFIINALFIGASYQLYERGYIPAAIILTSLEAGWYFGGINGAGLAANDYNRTVYERMGRGVLVDNHLFPVLMIQKGF